MIEFAIAGRDYRAEKLNAFQQAHVSRRISPLIPTLIPVFLQIAKAKGKFTDSIDAIAPLLQPFADGLATLEDAAVEYLISTCLSVVRTKHMDNWTPVWSKAQNVCMFEELNNLGALLPLVVRVIQENLGPFIQGLLSSMQTEEPKEIKLTP